MASPGNRHCAKCIGALSFPVLRANVRSLAATTDRDRPITSLYTG